MFDSFVGAVAPQGLAVTCQNAQATIANPNPPQLDYSQVVSATFKIRDPNYGERAWAAVLLNQSTAAVTLSHPFLAGDQDVPGCWRAVATLVFASGGAWDMEPVYWECGG